ncbi:MAG: 3-hydroxyacyl-CoA dehydrogenase NAD-binding domain-containing protein [Acidimicrobiales bacterium]
MMTHSGAFHGERRNGLGIIWFDVPGRSQNVLQAGFDHDLREALDGLTGTDGVEAIVIASGKPHSFCAGADVDMLDESSSAADLVALSRRAQRAMDAVRSLDVPVVVAIAGSCLGGGLELALAGRYRIAADDDDTEFGLPEVQLGLTPGAGGTQYLPRVVGVRRALDMMLSGTTVPPGKAKSMGLIDEVVHPSILIDVALETARTLAGGQCQGSRPGWRDRLQEKILAENRVGREVVFRTARSQIEARTGHRMPAPHRILDVVRTGLEQGVEDGLAAEAEAFGDLAMTPQSRSLRGIFFDRRALAREADDRVAAHDVHVERIGVVGGGLMGSGIAEVSLSKAGHSVRLRDVDDAATRAALASVHDVLDARHVRPAQQARRLDRLTVTTGTSGFGDVDACIEAVVENAEIKGSVFQQIEPLLNQDAILATNTSSIPLSDLVRHVARPDRFVGMHYFSPVGRVPLLEVVRGDFTSERTVAVATAIGRAQGKTVVVVGDRAGFYTSRILAAYLGEAARLTEAGADPAEIDGALESLGFPMGPFRLLDSVGIDVAHEISEVLHAALGDRFRPAPLLDRLVAAGHKGRKNAKGVYRYRSDDGEVVGGDEIDESVRAMLSTAAGAGQSGPSPETLAERCLLALVLEAVRCLDEGVIASARDGDAAAVFGLGFPPQIGGPFRYVDERGRAAVVDACRRLADLDGDRWSPPPSMSDTDAAASYRMPQGDGR